MKELRKIMTIFGTRPEAIKLAPVLHELERRTHAFQTVNVNSGQHRHLLQPMITLFRLRVDHDLGVHQTDQQPAEVSRRIVRRMLPILNYECPDLVLVQGDTSTAVAAAEAGSLMRIPVATSRRDYGPVMIRTHFQKRFIESASAASLHFTLHRH